MKRAKTVEVFYDDLRPEAQIELLEFYCVTAPEQLNWDVFPLFIFVLEDEPKRLEK